MRRKKAHEAPDNKERWLVSYADFITLLFAFFVVMYSISSVNEGKYKVLSETLEGVFNAPRRSPQPVEVGKPGEGEEKAADTEIPRVEPFSDPEKAGRSEVDGGGSEILKSIADQFYQELTPLLEDGRVSINENDQFVEISLRNSLLFSSGDAVPIDTAFPLIEGIAEILARYPNAIMIEGFTDNVPIRSSLYPSNWELSTARAAAVARMLIFGGVDATRVAAVGYGEFQPVANNRTAAGRQRNRRVVLLISKNDNVRETLRSSP